MEEITQSTEETTPVEEVAVEETPTTEVEGELQTTEAEEEAQEQKDYSEWLNEVNSHAKYLKEPTNIQTFEESIEYIQKGLNYDRAQEKYQRELESLQNTPELKFMKQFLADNGYESMDDYLLAKDVTELMNKEGMSEAVAIKHVQGLRALEAREEAQQAKEFEEQKTNLDTDNHAEAIKWYKEKGYGDLTSDKITDETWDKVKNGLPMKYAVMEQMFDNVKGDTEQDVLKKLKNHKDSSMPSTTSTAEKQSKSFMEMSEAEFKAEQAKVFGKSMWG